MGKAPIIPVLKPRLYASASRAVGTLRAPSHHQQDIKQRLDILRAALDELAVISGPLDGGDKERPHDGVG
jgi:hypothetical protein